MDPRNRRAKELKFSSAKDLSPVLLTLLRLWFKTGVIFVSYFAGIALFDSTFTLGAKSSLRLSHKLIELSYRKFCVLMLVILL